MISILNSIWKRAVMKNLEKTIQLDSVNASPATWHIISQLSLTSSDIKNKKFYSYSSFKTARQKLTPTVDSRVTKNKILV